MILGRGLLHDDAGLGTVRKWRTTHRAPSLPAPPRGPDLLAGLGGQKAVDRPRQVLTVDQKSLVTPDLAADQHQHVLSEERLADRLRPERATAFPELVEFTLLDRLPVKESDLLACVL